MFITIEGVEGSGKTSHIIPLANYLIENGYKVFTTREPGGAKISEQIRAIIHDLDNGKMHPRTETLLYQAARAQVVEEIIRPKIKEGYVVLCDRYIDSTIAYQGYGHKQSLTQIQNLIDYATDGLIPNLTILLDLDAAAGLERKVGMGEWNRLDAYALDFHQRVREGYLHISKMNSARWKVIDAHNNWDVVHRNLQELLSSFLLNNKHDRVSAELPIFSSPNQISINA